jgi:hypothetical protein
MNKPTTLPAAASAESGVQRRLLDRLREHSMTALLLLLLTTVFVIPTLMPYGREWHVVADVTITLALLSGFLTVSDRRSYSTLLGLVLLAALIVKWTSQFAPHKMLPEIHVATFLVAIGFLALLLGARVFQAGAVTFDRVVGAVTIYLALGIVWASAYELIALHNPHAFSGPASATESHDHWFYFSFVTLTTVGYGDIAPVARSARSLATLEAFVGQLYPAVVLARLVSLNSSRRNDRVGRPD